MATPLSAPEEAVSLHLAAKGPVSPPSGPKGAAAFAEALLHVDDPARCSGCGQPLESDHLTIEDSTGITRWCRSCVSNALEG